MPPCLSAFASHTGLRFDVPEPDSKEFQEWLNKMPPRLLGYEILVYLRHIGFPSPLLDWSRSPYVAAFFAFNRARLDRTVSIYCFRERVGKAKGGWVGLPMIVEHGTYVVTHDRHFAQQAAYTTCTTCTPHEIRYTSHERAEFGADQDVVVKIDMPGLERKRITSKLDQMNINMFTLFGSKESLADMLSYREIELSI